MDECLFVADALSLGDEILLIGEVEEACEAIKVGFFQSESFVEL